MATVHAAPDVPPCGDSDRETHLGDGIIDYDAAFKTASSTVAGTKNPSLRMRMTHNRKWPTKVDAVEHIGIHRSCSRHVKPADDFRIPTGLELWRRARICRRGIEIVYRDPATRQAMPVAVIVTTAGDENENEGPAALTMAPATSTATTKVFGPKPAFPGQTPINKQEGDNKNTHPLYLRARINMIPSNKPYFEYNATIEVITGRDGDGEASVCYESGVVPGPTGPQTVVRQSEPITVSAPEPPAAVFSEKDPERSGADTLDMTIAPGIDPCLIVCLAADWMNRQATSRRGAQTDALLGGCCSSFCC